MTTLSAITAGNVGAAATGSASTFSAHANGDLETIAGAVDSDYGEVTTNATGDYRDGYLLDATPSDFGTMNTLSVRLRYLWSATPTNTTWDLLACRIVKESDGTVLAGGSEGGAYESVASSITTTTATNSSVTGFTYVNQTATKSDWDDANIQIQITRTRSKGGGGQGQRVTAGEITGDYDIAVATDDCLADDLESAAEISKPAVGQTHVLLADDLQSSSELSSPAVGQEHALLADDLESSAEISTPAANVSVALLGDDLESSAEISSPSVGQAHVLLADDLESGGELSSPAVGQTHVLLADDLESTSEVSSPAVGQEHALLADDLESSAELSSPAVTESEVVEEASSNTGGGIGQYGPTQEQRKKTRRAERQADKELTRVLAKAYNAANGIAEPVERKAAHDAVAAVERAPVAEIGPALVALQSKLVGVRIARNELEIERARIQIDKQIQKTRLREEDDILTLFAMVA